MLGVDNNRDCIMNGINGAYRRVMNIRGHGGGNRGEPEWRRWNPAKTTIVFAVADAGTPFMGVGAELDPESGMLLDVVMGRKAAGASAYLSKLHNKGAGNGGFDVVSTQFAVHYMFADVDKARKYLQNVKQLLRPGGIFIGTCMDGKLVDAMLEENPTSRGTAGKSPNQTTIWEVSKAYDAFKPYGSIINVFLERTGHTIPEPLVDFDTFVDLAKNYGLALVESSTFDALYPAHVGELDEPLTADEERFSFLNRTFTFQKKGADPAAAEGGDSKRGVEPPPPSPEEIAAAEAERKQRESDAAKEKGPVKTIIVDARVAKTSFGGGGGDGGDGGGDGGVGGEEGV